MNRFFAAVLCFALLLTGCAGNRFPASSPELSAPAATLPPAGDPGTVACKSTYTGQGDPDAIAARMGDTVLTNRELQLWYRAEVAQYRQCHSIPDFSQPLDLQTCDADGQSLSWQQYFLRQALERWHTVQALIRHSKECPLPTEDAYQPALNTLHKYMDGMPATRVLYRFDRYYQPNSQHQTYLDNLVSTAQSLASGFGYPDTAALASEAFGVQEQDFLDFLWELNYAYMYFTTLSHDLEETEAAADVEPRVTFRQILLRKDSNTTLSECLGMAYDLVNQWSDDKNASADSFAQLAARNSQDDGSARNGGLYRNVLRQQLPEELAQWCFAPSRQEGDITTISTEQGVHIVYFLTREQTRYSSSAQAQLLSRLREEYPMEVQYSAIVLTEGDAAVSLSDLLYPDIAHQRFPEIPLYLQQSYPGSMYGNYKLTTNGCGITSLAMLASYMTDRELTPPALADRYGSYSGPSGTSGSLFQDAPPQLGFYLIKKTYDALEARDYLKAGYPVIVLQYKGYWTRGGHYLVLESITDEDMLQVRDSNMYNYAKLVRHKEDQFPWDTITGACQGFWIFEKKAVTTPSCIRCGDPESLPVQTVSNYVCEKCNTALVRRNLFLADITQ